MKGRIILTFVLLAAVVTVLALVFYTGTGVRLFTGGWSIRTAPEGALLAVEARPGEWGVYHESGRKVGSLTADLPPIWKADGSALFYRHGDGVWKFPCHDKGRPEQMLSDSGTRPVKALEDGRVLLTRSDDSGIRAFAFSNGDGKAPGSPKYHELQGSPAVLLRSSLEGNRVSYAVGADGQYRITILKACGTQDVFEEACSLDGANFAEHFWSPKGRYLIFSSGTGGVEVYDLQTEERRWITEASFTPCSLIPFTVAFDSDDTRMFMEVTDEHGYRQLSIFYLVSAREIRFTHGWIDHYGPAISKDGRYMAYRQGELPERAGQGEGGDREEELYLYDFETQRSVHLSDRPMRRETGRTGPILSGDARNIYFQQNGQIFQYPLLDD